MKTLHVPFTEDEFSKLEEWKEKKGLHNDTWHDFLLRESQDGR